MPAAGISKVLSCEPYSSAAWAIRPTLGTEPIVAGSKAPWARQSSMDGLVDAGVATSPGSPRGCRASSPSGPHMWPELRIIAGIEASMMTSEGTCRLVMPLSESTIARSRAVGEARLDRGLDRVALGQRCRPR